MIQLSDPCFDEWIEAHIDNIRLKEQDIARVSAVDRNSFLIRNELSEIPAELAGKFLFHVDSPVELPCVGDWVAVKYHNDGASAIIHELFPRRTFLRRKRPGSEIDFQMIAANIDIAFIVQSCHFDFNLARLNRYLVMAADGDVEPIVILAKTDLISNNELQEKLAAIREAGITSRIIALSNLSGSGVEEFRQVLAPSRTYCLLGSSGVGKTTLINHLIGRNDFNTKGVSGTGEGTHTTTRRQLIVLDNGVMFIDTPGMRELGLLGADEGIHKGFEDIIELSKACRFSDCSHTQESGCAVLAAIANGTLHEERYVGYLKLRKESEFHEMSYVEKRKKDRAFGRFIKNANKTKR
ncbi:ribosome small subunit-dependent GTPase A [Chlorobium phaeobacteroides]|uniref:Small ribosomal subunit biogenesis GTPase RsgA n=1 Tax=Chlorobium phaeobacteroides (strain DSM 266 / SMG 266 / 2430) TaxID=290317 RepID=A1BGU1_CHLPD|nr:ribosome small subunit-dependent GTPase A [Chlorobium phaeobacteroides]ABL65618.1 GTPase EngC [Chlorobium phaeobacteroides DSM 266]